MKKILLTVAICSSLFAQFSIKNWSVKAVGPSASRPATCSVNKDVFICSGSGCSPDPSLEYCTAANTYTAFSGGGSGTVTSVDAGNGVETVSGSAITSSGTIRGAIAINAQTGTTYTVLTGDRGKLITHSNGSSIAVTLPQAGASFPSGWFTYVQNLGAGTVTITPTTSTIDGAASLALTTNQGTIIVSDGTNYFTMRGIGVAGSGTVTSVATTSPITGGTITSSGTIACATCVTSAASLTSNELLIGGGSQASAALGSAGTTTTVLHGNAAGAPSFGAVALGADVSGTLPVANGGTGLTGGTSGGVPYYSGASTLASSGALTANLPVIGGGAGAAPTVGSRSGNTTSFATTSGTLTSGNCAKFDASGNIVDHGSACGGGSGATGDPGSLKLLETKTASSSSSLDFTSCISTTYDTYEVRISGMTPATNGASIGVQVSTDGGVTWVTTSSYSWSSYVLTGSGGGANGSLSDTAAYISPNQNSSTSTIPLDAVFHLHHPLSGTQYTAFFGRGYGVTSSGVALANIGTWLFNGSYKATTAVNAFRITASSGNLAQGEARCYGVAKTVGNGVSTPANYSQSFTSQTSVSLTHALGTNNVIVSCYDGSDVRIEPNSVTIAGSAPYAVTVTFTSAQTGRCVVNGGSASGNLTATGTYASNPGTCTDGDIRLPSDSVYILRCASNVWVPWGTVRRMYDPNLAGITTQVNYGSSTTTTNQGGIILKVPAGSGTQVRGLEKNVPTAPYTITATFSVLIANQDYMTCGVYLSDGTKFVTSGLAYSSFLGTAGPAIRVSKWASTTSFTGDYITSYATANLNNNGDLTFKIEDDNTNRKHSICMDPSGSHCMQIYSVGRTDYLTPTKVGIFCNTENTTYDARIWLKSWREQ